MYKNIFYLFLSVICCSQIIFSSGSPENQDFLKTFYTEVNPQKMPMGLIIHSPHHCNQNLKLNFVLYNVNNRNTGIDLKYNQLIAETYKKTVFQALVRNDKLHFLVNNLIIAQVELSDLIKSIKNFIEQKPLGGNQSGLYEINLCYELRGQQALDYKNYHHNSLKQTTVLVYWGVSTALDLTKSTEIKLNNTYENGKFSLVPFSENESKVLTCYNYNYLTLPLKVPEEKIMTNNKGTKSQNLLESAQVHSSYSEKNAQQTTEKTSYNNYYFASAIVTIVILLLADKYYNLGILNNIYRLYS